MNRFAKKYLHFYQEVKMQCVHIKETHKRRQGGARLSFNWGVIVGLVYQQLHSVWMDNLWQGRL